MARISSSTKGQRFRWSYLYIGVVLTSLATLLLELSLTRIFSVVFHYHFAFLAISIALFGLGAGGVFSYAVAAWRGNFYTKLGTISAINSLLVVVSLVFSLSIRQDLGFWALAAVYFPSTLPFFLAGTVISLVIAETMERVDRVYFYDLMGAGVGCLLLIPLLNGFGGPNTVIATAAIYAASAAIWYSLAGTVRGRAVSVALALCLLVLLGYNARSRVIDVKYAKGKELHNEEFVKWNSFSRIAVAPEKGTGSPSIIIDADAATAIAGYNFDKLTEAERKDLLSQGPGIPYALRPGAKALIIGPGGGYDVARALASGSRDVTGVEINPIIARTVMRERFSKYSWNLYARPEVHIEIEDGRSFLRRSRARYGVIQATLVDTWASTAAGAYALSENNLYTSDAFYDYLTHLTDDGVVSFTRWGLEPPRESLRLISLARTALNRLGEHEAWRHVIVLREGSIAASGGWGALDTVLLSRKPFQQSDFGRLQNVLAGTRIRTLYAPDQPSTNEFSQFLHARDPKAFERSYPYDISAVNDDRPFFFYSVQPRDVLTFLGYFLHGSSPTTSRADFQINMAVPVMFGLLAVSLVATAVMLALPPLVLGARLPKERSTLAFLLYFMCIGVGYILIEVALIQRFVLFLGHPTYALTVIIFSMLIASGCGSYWSRRVVGLSPARLSGVLVLVAIAVAILASTSSAVTETGVGWPLWLKFLATVVLLAPPAFFMGMPFPTGLSMLELRHKPSIRWAWALNAAASVLGSVSAIFLAIYLGLRDTLLFGGVMYLVALMILWLTRPVRAGVQTPAAESASRS